MAVTLDTTVHDMKTHFSQYSADLLAGKYDEIVVKNRTQPTLRILRYEDSVRPGLAFGVAKQRGHGVVCPEWDMRDGDAEISDLFGEYL